MLTPTNFSPNPDDKILHKDAMEPRTTKKMANYKFDPLKKDTNIPSTPFQHCWLTLLECGEGIYLETEEDYKIIIHRSCSRETLETVI